MTLPNFLIIGAAKSGTTALFNLLGQHPEIYPSSHKEPNYFAFAGQKVDFQGPGDGAYNRSCITDLPTYERLFAPVKPYHKAWGEASTVYIYQPETAQRIQALVPDVKLIAVLRNPVGRAFSSYQHLVRDGYETLSFEDALAQEETRIQANWQHLYHYTRQSIYAPQLQPYFELFDRAQMRVYLYDDFKTAPETILKDVFQFLGVDENVHIDTDQRWNIAGKPRNQSINRFLNTRQPLKEMIKPLIPFGLRKKIMANLTRLNVQAAEKTSLKPETHQRLRELFHADILVTQDLLQRDLSIWLKPPAHKQEHIDANA